ncbi:uncharacterized protein A4U43_C05F29690 [Asparagus officinalis]|uniref:KHA domain-containing protein n=2 Tax=Asparagus officinalis TaxID=4686 RepID=A0A5P1EVJ2_ASPOF|nr:uncharacterized protein A4U43_C05F29690 [Asparagus officinalis]
MGQFVCIAAEQNNLELLQNIVHYGGDVTVPRSDGTTALHFAVSEGNINMVKFLVDQGADIDKLNSIGWSSRNLADQQGHEEIIAFFQSKRGQNDNVDTRTSRNISPSVHFGRYRSEPTMHHVAHEVWHTTRTKNNGGNVHQRKTISNYDNSLFGIMSAARVNVGSDGLFSTAPPLSTRSIGDQNPIRVTICCPEKEDRCGKLVLLPGSITELLEIGAKKFEFLPTKVLSQDRAEINELGVIRDGDRLFLVSDDWNREVHS